MKNAIHCLFVILFLTGCYRHTYKVYEVNERLHFKRKFRKPRPLKHEDYDKACLSRYYKVPESVCNDSVKLRALAIKVFRKDYHPYMVEYFKNSGFKMGKDSIAQFQFPLNGIKGSVSISYNKNKRIITYRSSYR